MKETTIYLYGLILIALFTLGCILCFNSGFNQGVIKAKDCIYNNGSIELGFNSFECNTSHNSTLIDNFEKFKNFNFSEVKIQ